MPTSLKPSLVDVAQLAETYSTSLTATALRFVRFAPEPCAVVHSTNGVVDWLDWSDDFKLGIKKEKRLTTRTYAGDIFAGASVDDRQQQVDETLGATITGNRMSTFSSTRGGSGRTPS